MAGIFDGLEHLDCNTGNKPGMSFREVILMLAKDHPEMLVDTLEKIRQPQLEQGITDKYNSIRKLRSDNGRFPIDDELNPIIIIWTDGGEINVAYCKKGDKIARAEMRTFIKNLKDKDIVYRIIGTWAGKYSTDTFKFDSDELFERLKEKIE